MSRLGTQSQLKYSQWEKHCDNSAQQQPQTHSACLVAVRLSVVTHSKRVLLNEVHGAKYASPFPQVKEKDNMINMLD